MEELLAISITLFAHNVDDDKDSDIVADIGWVFDDGVRDKEDGSNIFKAVAGQEESNSSFFNCVI